MLDHGRTKGTLAFTGTPQTTARLLVGALEGAMLVARVHDDPARFTSAAERLLDGLTT